MCDYCGCRSHPAIASLSVDHEVMLGLLATLRRAAHAHDQPAAMAVTARLHDLLDPHATREEQGVFTELRDAGVDGSYVDMFESEHARIHAMLEATTGGDWEQIAAELVELLGGHISREESDLFPAAHQLFAPGQWDAVDAVHNHVRIHE